ncbi:MAG: rhomboid family intramembrane serine protease [Lachnospiraceae bacterium]|nr:rhomboid family intramembrane serine protease [Lachnospiraceae bacterium]
MKPAKCESFVEEKKKGWQDKVDYAIICHMLDKIERKIGRFAIKNLIYYLLGGYLIGYILYFTNSRLGIYNYIVLDPAMVMKGQVWRLFTWICTIPQGISIFIIFMFLLYFYIGKGLEQTLGAFKYNVYIFSGWFFMTLGAMAVYWITGVSMDVSTYYINLASFLAFAVLYPNTRIYFFGILPVRMKWLAIFDIIYLGVQIISGIISLFALPNPQVQTIISQFGIEAGSAKIIIITEIFSIVISLLNFLIFFLATRNLRRLSPQEIHRRADFRKKMQEGMEQNRSWMNQRMNQQGYGQGQSSSAGGPFVSNGVIVHRCSICGRTNLTNPDLTFRYCSKCAGNHEYCQEHLFTHVHVK